MDKLYPLMESEEAKVNALKQRKQKEMEAQFTRGGFLPSKQDIDDAGYGFDTPATAALLEQQQQQQNYARKGAGAPQIDLPQRVGHPSSVKAPGRENSTNRDENILRMFGSSLETSGKGTRSYTQNNNTALSQLKDLSILAKTCRRAGKTLQEAQAHYCRAVLFDNLQSWQKAIEAYESYLELCNRMGDHEGISVAFNCLGVAYFNMACGGAKATSRAVGLLEESPNNEVEALLAMAEAETTPREEDPIRAKYLETSLVYHEKHYDCSEESGRYVALINIGLCYSRLGNHNRAIDFHQQALRLAIDLKSSHGQSLAVGNLALASAEVGDWETSKACMDKHLHLVRDLQNFEAESLACQQLGQIANKHGNFEEATRYFEEARKIAKQSGERGMLKLINCNLGVSQGNLRMLSYIKELTKHISDI